MRTKFRSQDGQCQSQECYHCGQDQGSEDRRGGTLSLWELTGQRDRGGGSLGSATGWLQRPRHWLSPWTPTWGHLSPWGSQARPGSRNCILGFCFPGCFSLQGPESVRGLVGGSVTMQCYYTPGWKAYEKWWCRGAEWNSCQILVQTNGSEQEVKGDRVSIRDNQRHGLLTVTMEEVRRDDTDTYWCGISRNGPDLGASVKVTIDPADRVLSTPASPRSTTTTSGRAGASSDSYISCQQKSPDELDCAQGR
uniref:CD300 molecule like family member b n=1 Tax=Ailuropoda melanoleuca TaxID=9646 RepID=G1L3H9_AILME